MLETLSPRRVLRLIGARYCWKSALARPVRAPQTAEDMAFAASKNIDKCRCQILIMPAAMAIFVLRLVDDRPGGHGPLPGLMLVVSRRPIPRPLWCVSRLNLRGDADFLTTK